MLAMVILLVIIKLICCARWSDAHLYLKKKSVSVAQRASIQIDFNNIYIGESRPTEWFATVYHMFCEETERDNHVIINFFESSVSITELTQRINVDELANWIGQTFLDATRRPSLFQIWLIYIWDRLPEYVRNPSIGVIDSINSDVGYIFVKFHSLWDISKVPKDHFRLLVKYSDFEDLLIGCEMFLECHFPGKTLLKSVLELDVEKVLMTSIECDLRQLFKIFVKGEKFDKKFFEILANEKFDKSEYYIPMYLFYTGASIEILDSFLNMRTTFLAIEMYKLVFEKRYSPYRQKYDPVRTVEVVVPPILLLHWDMFEKHHQIWLISLILLFRFDIIFDSEYVEEEYKNLMIELNLHSIEKVINKYLEIDALNYKKICGTKLKLVYSNELKQQAALQPLRIPSSTNPVLSLNHLLIGLKGPNWKIYSNSQILLSDEETISLLKKAYDCDSLGYFSLVLSKSKFSKPLALIFIHIMKRHELFVTYFKSIAHFFSLEELDLYFQESVDPYIKLSAMRLGINEIKKIQKVKSKTLDTFIDVLNSVKTKKEIHANNYDLTVLDHAVSVIPKDQLNLVIDSKQVVGKWSLYEYWRTTIEPINPNTLSEFVKTANIFEISLSLKTSIKYINDWKNINHPFIKIIFQIYEQNKSIFTDSKFNFCIPVQSTTNKIIYNVEILDKKTIIAVINLLTNIPIYDIVQQYVYLSSTYKKPPTINQILERECQIYYQIPSFKFK